MAIVISVVLAYVLSGAAQVVKDLNSRGLDRPQWALRPNAGMAMFIAASWPVRFFIDQAGPRARVIALGIWATLSQMAVVTLLMWGCISLATSFFDHPVIQIVSAAVLVIVGMQLVLPLLTLLMMPITLIVAWPLELLFPLKDGPNRQKIEWCRECQHYRRSKEYEDALTGLWHAPSMPRSDKLPCTIPVETSAVWTRYFASDPKARTLFPKCCPSFVARRA